jgi:beta-glucosidase
VPNPTKSAFQSKTVRQRHFFRQRLAFCAFFFLFLGLLHADETAPSPCGKSFTISGKITHSKLPAGVTVEGAPADDTYNEEVFGPSFNATVTGLPAGTYTVEIDFAEVYYKGPGQRVMKITSGDTILADNLDLYAVAGFAKAYKTQATVVHQDDAIQGPLVITFTAIKDNAKFNAIHILDAQGGGVACVKASDLVDNADIGASKIPQVSDPVIYTDPDKPMDARIDDLISRMSLSEKVGQIMNVAPVIPRLNIPAYDYWNECLHGVAFAGHATVFPQVIGLAAAWDEEKIHQVGEVISIEGRAKYYQAQRDGKHGRHDGLNYWAPNINIFRDPRWGRGQETYGEDPYLTGRMGVNLIEGIQGNDPHYLEGMACAKHYAVHSGPEAGRGGFNVDPDIRDVFETYLPQFQAAVEEGHVGAVMAAYNAIYGVPCSCNSWLLTDILRNTWGFTGHVVSDCGAVSNIPGAHRYARNDAEGDAYAIKAGLDLECGGSYHALTKSVAQGLVTEKEIDTALHRVLTIRFRLGLFDPPERVPWSNTPMTEVESPEHLALARTLARESMVLLKNDNVLPLDKTKLQHIVVLGPNADVQLNGNYSGTPTKPITILQGIRNEVGEAVKVDFFKGCPRAHNPNRPKDDVSPEDYQKALDDAKTADVIVYVGGLDTEMEGEESGYVSPGFSHGDRLTIELPAVQEKLLQDLEATGKPVVFVNCSGSAIAMPWEAANIPAILQAWYPGGQAGAAVADVLFGNYNPSGRLPITFYEKTADLPEFTDYRMANRTYRYFTGKALFPFGFGLSYTTFEYLPVTPASAAVTAKDTLHLTVPVKNTGDRDGDEVVQVYLHHTDSPVPQPIRSLVAFKRVTVAKGATVNVDFDIPVERFHYWSVEQKKYVVDAGRDDIQIGASSSDIRQTCAVTVK